MNTESLISWVEDRRDREKYREAMARSSPQAMLDYYTAADFSDPVLAKFPLLRSPALVIQGLADEEIKPATLNGQGELSAAPLTQVTLPGVHHDVQRERSQLVNQTVRRWIEAQTPAVQEVNVKGAGKFHIETINPYAPNGYRMKAADLDGDGFADIIYLGETIKWMSSKTKAEYFLSSAQFGGYIDIAPYDIDGDGNPEVVAAGDFDATNSKSGGLYLFTKPSEITQPWKSTLISEEPTLHRYNGRKSILVRKNR